MPGANNIAYGGFGRLQVSLIAFRNVDKCAGFLEFHTDEAKAVPMDWRARSKPPARISALACQGSARHSLP
jgi:hypothetical protein